MEVISTTNPPPPSGVTPTQIPLSISASISQTTNPVNVVKATYPMVDDPSLDYYYGYFTIDTSKTPGTKVFQFDTRFPTGSDINNPYTNISGADQTLVFNIPWSLVRAFYSKQCRIDFELTFVPVKVADSRVSLDAVFNYDEYSQGYNTATLSNDSIHWILDDVDNQKKITIPSFWVTNNVQTDAQEVNFPSGNDYITVVNQPPFLPSTRLDLFVRGPYQPNMMQPNYLDVHVFVRPIVRQTVGITGKALVTTIADTVNEYFPKPWFINWDRRT